MDISKRSVLKRTLFQTDLCVLLWYIAVCVNHQTHDLGRPESVCSIAANTSCIVRDTPQSDHCAVITQLRDCTKASHELASRLINGFSSSLWSALDTGYVCQISV